MLNSPIHHEIVKSLLAERRTAADDRRSQALATLAAAEEPRRRRLRCAVRGSRPAACPQLACSCATG